MLVVLVVAKTERQRARRALRDQERVIHQGGGEAGGAGACVWVVGLDGVCGSGWNASLPL
jgi:hypothetical protein